MNINKFLNLVDQYPNLKEFYDYFRTKGKNILKDSASIENGVSLITMHKSKGLEYDSVYVPVKYSEENFSKFTLVKTDDNVIFLKKKKYVVLTQFEKYINIYQEKEKLEFYNLIYVALTRAKKNLIIIPDKKA
ncbi:3'-5' exonuclease [Sneathia vaginalis]|uniref:3'-5' exonuclease n=1 Tax=Sneathia vaginalis TaxID=187101 RepID=UPI00254F42DE|nr:3'-5' exonuclease [Sneathia vaginalis]MDK9582267.1 3'-5' exonuclease [Sneathia vaginalis]